MAAPVRDYVDRSAWQGLARRLRDSRAALAIAAIAFLVVWATGGIHGAVAVAAYLAVAVVIVLSRTSDPAGRIPDAGTEPPADPVADYAVVAQGLPEPCFLIDGAGGLAFQNEAARRLFGPLPVGQPITSLLRDPEVGSAVATALSTGQQATVTFFERVPNERWFELRVTALGRPGEQRAARRVFLVLLRDLTEARRVERMRADFVANASHELRTPLASLSGFIETLQGPARNDPAARERFLEVMAEQARRMSRLIDDLMSLSRIEVKAHVAPETIVDLAPIVEHVVDAMLPLASESGLELAVEIRDRPLPVRGDRDELAQVFQNLVHNAIKYGHEGRRVEITARAERRTPAKPARAIVTVIDFGQGIAPEHLPRLTERFYRVDTATSRAKGGTGLGLAIVKHIIARHRGQLMIESEPGKGAAFSVAIDLADAPSSLA